MQHGKVNLNLQFSRGKEKRKKERKEKKRTLATLALLAELFSSSELKVTKMKNTTFLSTHKLIVCVSQACVDNYSSLMDHVFIC